MVRAVPDLHERYQAALERLTNLSYRIGELDAYLGAIAVAVSDLLQVDWSVITFCQGDDETLLASNIDLGEAANETYQLHGTVTGSVVACGNPLAIHDLSEAHEHGDAPDGYQAYLGVPLKLSSGAVVGTICSFHQQVRRFSADDIQIAALFADRAATALDNVQLYQSQLEFNERLEVEVAQRTQELQAAQAKLIEQERLAAIGEFSASIVHEIRNPLSTIKLALGSVQKRAQLPAPMHEQLAIAQEETVRLEHLLTEILHYSKPQCLKLETVELNGFLGEILDGLRSLPTTSSHRLRLIPHSESTTVQADPSKLKQVVINLVTNGCEASPVSAEVTCRVGPGQFSVHNGGEPIPPEVLGRMTEPFFTTKSAGTGLGLPIVHRIVTAHGGKLVIESDADLGTRISVQFPIH